MMRQWSGGVLLTLMLVAAPWAGANGPTASWEGLTGLYTQPTAEIMPRGNVAFTFSELRFKQGNGTERLKNSWFAGTLTYAPTSRLELAVTDRHEIVKLGPDEDDITTQLDETAFLGHVKYVLAHPGPRKLGLAVGVQDITNATDRIETRDMERGRRVYLVGTYDWANAGVFHRDGKLGGFIGARFRLTENIDLVGELNSRPQFAHLIPEPNNTMNFNLGLRLYPAQVPRLRIDVTAIGDGQFDFGFSLSYNFSP